MKYAFFLLIFASQLYAQDSLVVKQRNSVMFSNYYVFYNDGTFKHYYQTDDLQIWYGIGNFQDQGRKRILKFKNPDMNFRREFILVHYEANFERTLLRKRNSFKSADFYNTTKNKFVIFEH